MGHRNWADQAHLTANVGCLQVDRRAALGLLAGAAALVAAQPSEAAYGEAARVFASGATNTSGEQGWSSDRARTCAAGVKGGAELVCVCLMWPPWTAFAGFIPYAGQGWAVLIPSKWNPSKERDFPNVVFRCGGAVCASGVGS